MKSKPDTISSLETGDALITAKRTLEAVLVLSKQNNRRFLLPILDKNSSLRISVAHFIESLVLHERIFCSFSPEIFHGVLLNADLEDLSGIVNPLPLESLFLELDNSGSLDIESIRLGYERLNKEPNLVLSTELNTVFNHNYPQWATTRNEKRGETPSLQEAGSRHFQHYEGVAAFTTGIAYCLTKPEGQHSVADTEIAGYKIYGDTTLLKTVQAAKTRIEEINSWFNRERYVLEAPLVFNHVIEKASTKHDLLSVVIDLRYSKEAIAFRKQCTLFDQALKDGDDKAAIEMIDEVDDKIKQLTKNISGPKLSIDIAFPFSASLKLSELLKYLSSKRKRHLIFISQLYESALRSRDVYDRFQQLL